MEAYRIKEILEDLDYVEEAEYEGRNEEHDQFRIKTSNGEKEYWEVRQRDGLKGSGGVYLYRDIEDEWYHLFDI